MPRIGLGITGTCEYKPYLSSEDLHESVACHVRNKNYKNK
jgi:hypothetical protein